MYTFLKSSLNKDNLISPLIKQNTFITRIPNVVKIFLQKSEVISQTNNKNIYTRKINTDSSTVSDKVNKRSEETIDAKMVTENKIGKR